MAKSKKPVVWILEDDEGCRFVYAEILKNDFEPVFFDRIQNFSESLKDILKKKPVFVIADLTLADGNFLNFLNSDESKEFLAKIPFIVVSSNDDIEALRACFKEGANDYITKPFKKNELLVKIEYILRDRNFISKSIRPIVVIDGVEVKNLTAKQIKLVNLFLEEETRVVERNSILQRIWGNTVVDPKTIDVHIYNLRRKLHPFGFMIRSEGGGKWSLLPDRINP